MGSWVRLLALRALGVLGGTACRKLLVLLLISIDRHPTTDEQKSEGSKYISILLLKAWQQNNGVQHVVSV